MQKKTNKKPKFNIKTKKEKTITYPLPEGSINFYISEETATYGKKKPFTIYYDNPEHSVRLLKGDCIEILNQATEIVLWAAKNEKSKHYFDYQLMKKINDGRQMRNVWQFSEEQEEQRKID